MENPNFWDVHGIGFIICMMLSPRLTLLFGTVIGGFWWWVGWLFGPKLMVAIIATQHYFDTNPTLVVFTWIWALTGEAGEKTVVHKKTSRRKSTTTTR